MFLGLTHKPPVFGTHPSMHTKLSFNSKRPQTHMLLGLFGELERLCERGRRQLHSSRFVFFWPMYNVSAFPVFHSPSPQAFSISAFPSWNSFKQHSVHAKPNGSNGEQNTRVKMSIAQPAGRSVPWAICLLLASSVWHLEDGSKTDMARKINHFQSLVCLSRFSYPHNGQWYLLWTLYQTCAWYPFHPKHVIINSSTIF